MKKKLMIPLLFLLTVTFTATAQKDAPSKIQVSTPVSYHDHFTNIVVSDGIDLVLTENIQDKIWFEGKSKHIDKLKWEIKNGTLYLASKSGSLKDKVKVNVYVQQLTNILVNGDSWVKSSGYLTSASLDVLINGEALVDIANVGKISVKHSNDFELGVMKRTSGVSVQGTTTRK
jgi:hypothetical protein